MSGSSHILLIDDNLDAQMIALAALEDGAFDTVKAVGSADEAYALLDLEDDDAPPAFDCILLDILMSDIDGVEACARIRSSRRYRDVPIVMVSGQHNSHVLTQAFVAGANDYVTKPINPLELLSRVRASLRFKREIDRRRLREQQLRARRSDVGAVAGGFGAHDGLPDRDMLEARLRAAADADTEAAVVMLTIEDWAGYVDEHGVQAADILGRRITRELLALPAPLGAMFGSFDAGTFLVLLPGDTAAEAIAVARAASTRIAALTLPHGASAKSDHVRLLAAAEGATGDALLQVPTRLIAEIEQASRGSVGMGESDLII